MRVCLACGRRLLGTHILTPPSLCQPCADEIKALQVAHPIMLSPQHPVWALYGYRDPLRSLVVKAKAATSISAANILSQCFAMSPRAQELLDWCDLVVVAPSSLWSRLRGRMDLAYHLADALQSSRPPKERRQVASAPWHMYWRTFKRAQRSRAMRNIDQRQFFRLSRPLVSRWGQRLLRHKRVLVIDDIMTSGLTLSELLAEIPGKIETRGLVLAAATQTPQDNAAGGGEN